MSKLVSTYAKSTGLKIAHPEVKEHFYPFPFDRYMTVQTGSGQGAKNYDYFAEVLLLIKPALDKAGISIIHLGSKDDPQLPGVHDLRGKTTIQQTHFIVKRSSCHMGNDSWIAHCAGWNYRPLVALYGSTAAGPHGPYWNDPAVTILLESHRWGGKPTFVSQEAQKAINVIPPEQIAASVLKLLSLSTPVQTKKSLFIGPLFQHIIFELVPDSFPTKDFYPQFPFTVRLDYHFDEQMLAGCLSTGRKVNIVTNKPLNLNLINQFRQSILFYSHELMDGDETSLDYIKSIKTLIPKTTFFTKEKDEVKLAALRFRLFDVVNIEQVTELTRNDAVNWAKDYLNESEEKKLDITTQLCQAHVKSNKFLLSSGKVYLSYAHFKTQKSIENLNQNVADVIDDPEFWKDINHFYIYE